MTSEDAYDPRRTAALVALSKRGVDWRLLELIKLLPDTVPVHVKVAEGSAEFVPVSAGPDCQAAIYAERRRFVFALDPAQAERALALTEWTLTVEERNPTTVRLAVSAESADGELYEAEQWGTDSRYVEFLTWALLRSADRASRSRPDERSDPRRAPEVDVCPVCFLALPTTKACDDHGALRS